VSTNNLIHVIRNFTSPTISSIADSSTRLATEEPAYPHLRTTLLAAAAEEGLYLLLVVVDEDEEALRTVADLDLYLSGFMIRSNCTFCLAFLYFDAFSK
jgi:uncharacterized protein with GYD domain